MSTIFGKCNKDGKPLDPRDLEIMKDELNHWGADDLGIWCNNRVGLGHLMLYNTPESVNEKQPLHNSVSRLSVIADARIDNREELYTLLQISTPEEKKLPDSSIILLLYKKYGAACVKHLAGDFAFAIWDEQEQKLFCARDQMGVKPFFYYNGNNFFAFATEKKGLLCLPGIDKSIDKQFYYNQLLWPRIQAADTTLYKNIRRLEPAHTLTFHLHTNKIQFDHYWDLDADKEIKFQREEDYYEGLLHHFDAAVTCRLRSYYPVGAELSGGIDSSAITGAASHFLKKAGKNITTFSNVANGKARDNNMVIESEEEYAAAVIAFNSIQDYVFIREDIWNNPLDEIDFLLKVNDGLEKWSLPWQIPIKHAALQKNVRTLLSGFPGDEMVTYSGRFYFLDYLDQKQYGKYFLSESKKAFNKLKPFIHPEFEFYLHKLKNVLAINGEEIRLTADYFKLPLHWRFKKGDVAWEDDNYGERFKSYRHFQKYRLLKPQVPLRMETESRFGLSFKTETRFPMADIRLTQFYLSIPNHLKYKGELSRTMFRDTVKNYLPFEVFSRDDKSGNTAPFRLTTEAMNKRKKVILELLYSSDRNNNDNIRNNKNIKFHENIRYQIALLELLRWHQIHNAVR